MAMGWSLSLMSSSSPMTLLAAMAARRWERTRVGGAPPPSWTGARLCARVMGGAGSGGGSRWGTNSEDGLGRCFFLRWGDVGSSSSGSYGSLSSSSSETAFRLPFPPLDLDFFAFAFAFGGAGGA
jgi:hypothetical protein